MIADSPSSVQPPAEYDRDSYMLYHDISSATWFVVAAHAGYQDLQLRIGPTQHDGLRLKQQRHHIRRNGGCSKHPTR